MPVHWKQRAEKIYSVLFPPFCLNCGREGDYICSHCQLFLIEAEPVCHSCRQSVSKGANHRPCPLSACGYIPVWEDGPVITKIVQSTKSRSLEHVLGFLSEEAVKVLLANESLNDFWLAWFDQGTLIQATMGGNKGVENLLAEKLLHRFFDLTNRPPFSLNSSNQKAVLLGFSWHDGILNEIEELRQNGRREIWVLLLIGKSC